jgi:hypothetical protein
MAVTSSKKSRQQMPGNALLAVRSILAIMVFRLAPICSKARFAYSSDAKKALYPQ